ncbi:hypothetical protein [Helicobacter bilis]|nr:hypothetical protein [Helicobacter bilis]
MATSICRSFRQGQPHICETTAAFCGSIFELKSLLLSEPTRSYLKR